MLKIVNNAIILHEMRSIDEMLSEMDFDSNKLVCISDNFYLTKFPNFVSELSKNNFTVPMGPCRCFATITSARL